MVGTVGRSSGVVEVAREFREPPWRIAANAVIRCLQLHTRDQNALRLPRRDPDKFLPSRRPRPPRLTFHHIDALRVDGIVVHDSARDARDQRRFTATSPLVLGAKPIPTLRRVRVARLCGIDHETGLFLRNQIRSRPGGEIIRSLSAAVQHNNQRNRLTLIAARNVQLVGAAARRIGITCFKNFPPSGRTSGVHNSACSLHPRSPDLRGI